MSRRADWAHYRAMLRVLEQEEAKVATPEGEPPTAEYTRAFNNRASFQANRRPEPMTSAGRSWMRGVFGMTPEPDEPAYVTEVSEPWLGDGDQRVRMHNRMLAEPEAE